MDRASVARLWVAFARTRNQSMRERLILQYSPLVKYVIGRVALALNRAHRTWPTRQTCAGISRSRGAAWRECHSIRQWAA